LSKLSSVIIRLTYACSSIQCVAEKYRTKDAKRPRQQQPRGSHDEIFTRQKHHADLKGRGWLRLDPGETKNGEGRNFPFTVRLREVIE
jgi:hypothetical protein